MILQKKTSREILLSWLARGGVTFATIKTMIRRAPQEFLMARTHCHICNPES